MICPKCGNESHEKKWCPICGAQLEIDDIENPAAYGYKPYETLQEYESNSQTEPEGYGSQYHTERDSYYTQDGGEDKTGKGLKIALAIVCPVAGLVLIFTVLTVLGVIDFGSSTQRPESDIAVVSSAQEDEISMKKALNYMEIGIYEDAEHMFKDIMEKDPYNDEAKTLYLVVYNYQRASEKIKKHDYTQARKHFDKIPVEYEDYAISADVDNLEKEIIRHETTYKAFENVKEYMHTGDYETAYSSLEYIDESCLTSDELKELGEYRKEIEKHLKEEEASLIPLSKADADALIRSYCKAYSNAINSADFEIVEPYLAGDLYYYQKESISGYILEGVTTKFDFLNVLSVQAVSSGKWKINVSEGETITYSDGSAKTMEYSRTYTVEYIDMAYYLTKME